MTFINIFSGLLEVMQYLVELKQAYCNNQLQKVKELEVIMMRMIDNSQFSIQILDVLNSSIGENQMGQLMFIVSLITLLMKRICKYNDVNLTHFYSKLTQTQVNNVILKKSAQLMAVYLEKNVKELPKLVHPPFNSFTLMILSELVVLDEIAPFLSEWLFVQNNIKPVFELYLVDPCAILLEILENSLELYKDNLDFIQFVIQSIIPHIKSTNVEDVIKNDIHLLSVIANISVRPNILAPILIDPNLHTALQQYCMLEITGEFYIQFLDVFKKSNPNPSLDVVNAFYQVGLQFSNQTFPICLYSLYLFDYCCKFKVSDISPILHCCVAVKPLINEQQDEDKIYIQQAMSKVQSILGSLGREHALTSLDLIMLNGSKWGLTKSCQVLTTIIRNIQPDLLNQKKLHDLLCLLLAQFDQNEQFTKVVLLLAKKLPNDSLYILEQCLCNRHFKNASSITQTICMHHSRILYNNYSQIAPSIILNDTVPIAMKFSICCIPLLSHAMDNDLFALLQKVPIPNFKPQLLVFNINTDFNTVYPNSEDLISFLILAEQFLRLRNVLLDPLKSSIIEIPVNIRQLYNSFLEYICQGLKDLHSIMHANKFIGPSSIDRNQILRKPNSPNFNANSISESPINIQINLLATQCYDLLGLALAWPLFYENELAISILSTFVFTSDVVELHLKYWNLIITNMIIPCVDNSKASQHKVLLTFILKPFLLFMAPLISKRHLMETEILNENVDDSIVQSHYLHKLTKSFITVVEQSMTMMSSESFGEERAILLGNSFGLLEIANEGIMQRYMMIIKENISVLFTDVQVNSQLLEMILFKLFKCYDVERLPSIISIVGIIIKHFVGIKDPMMLIKCITNSNINMQTTTALTQFIHKIKDEELSEKGIKKQLTKLLQ
eukprot:NODE_1_length_95616_cov_0.657642.p3 type:complete len:897 gc:universal NODE_1_length_95616_cov_0.657642:6872-4182(-)